MDFFKVRNFERFQHYTDRRPPWIKLYRDLWDDQRFYSLSDQERYLLIGIFIIASQQDNKVPFDTKWLQAKLLTRARIPLEKLIATGWIERLEQNASSPQVASLNASAEQATRYPSRARGETETEVQNTETEREGESARTSYGEFNQVHLSDQEYDKLEAKLGETQFTDYLSRLDRYSQTNPTKFRKYKSHYAVILDWADRDKHNGGNNGKSKAEQREQRLNRVVRETLESLDAPAVRDVHSKGI